MATTKKLTTNIYAMNAEIVKEYAVILLPTFFTVVSLHSDNLFATLVFYNSVCIQKMDKRFYKHCGNMENFPEAEDYVQQESAQWIIATTVATQVPALFASLIFGPLTDHYGRKFAIILGQFGIALRMTSLAIFAAQPQLNLWFYVAVCALAGCTGFAATYITSLAAHISDTTEDGPTRSVKMIMIYVATSTAGIVTSLQGGGIPIYFDVSLVWQCILAGSYGTIGILVSFMIFQEKFQEEKVEHGQFQCTTVLITPFVLLEEAWNCLLQPRKGHTRAFLIIGVVMMLMILFADYPIFSLLNLYTYRRPFEWRQEMSSLYKLINQSCSLVGKLIAAILLAKVLGLRDTTLTLISMTSLIIFMVTISFAQSTPVLMSSAVTGMFVFLGFGTVLAFLSKLVPAQDLGKILSFAAFGQNLAPLLAGLLVNGLYALTEDIWPGLCFFGIAVLISICWVVMFVVRCLEIRQEKIEE